MQSPLPHLSCSLVEFGALTADPTAAPWVALAPVQLLENVSGGRPSQPTDLRIAHDGRELRVLFVAIDNDPHATLTERDAPLYTEEVVEVFLDPIGDLEGYFEFEVNPNNAKLDLVLRRVVSGYRKDFRWQCEGFESAVRKGDEGWSAEFAIPFASLGNASPANVWRANFHRIDRPRDQPAELSAWSPTFGGSFHVARKFGFVEFG